MRIQGGKVWNSILLNDIDINDNIYAFKKSLKSHLLKSMQWILKDTNRIKPKSIYLTKLVFFVCSLILQSLHIHGWGTTQRREWILDELRNRFCTIFATDYWQRTRSHDECVHKMANIIRNYRFVKPYKIHNIA